MNKLIYETRLVLKIPKVTKILRSQSNFNFCKIIISAQISIKNSISSLEHWALLCIPEKSSKTDKDLKSGN